MTDTCARVDCDRPAYSLQHCRQHYRRWLKTGTLIVDEPSPLIDAQPLVAAIERRLVGQTLTWLMPDKADQAAYHRARKSGRISEVVADRIAVRALRMTIDEVTL